MRPRCDVERDWLRVAARKFREMVPNVDEAALVTVRFDGSFLWVSVADTQVALMASGRAWPEEYFMTFSDLLMALKRLMLPYVEISTWKDCLQFGHRILPLVSRPTNCEDLG